MGTQLKSHSNLSNVERLDTEVAEIRARYDRRPSNDRQHNSLLHAYRYMPNLEKQRALLRLLGKRYGSDLSQLDFLEVGCGHGNNLRLMIHWGLDPSRIIGNELLPERLEHTSRRVPSEVRLHAGDALKMDVAPESIDIVMASTVFSSILDADFRRALARQMWSWVRPGGGVLWYDFTVNNPKNPDVRKVTARELSRLFPDATNEASRITLAPPLARLVCRLHPSLYSGLNLFPFLRTHLIAWLGKPH
ncbi:MAG: methyltransferase domain-containing protein [Planctomycetales bacterium]|nr:methyltransferase domain-containing protein [Planctomycetales bacterium]